MTQYQATLHTNGPADLNPAHANNFLPALDLAACGQGGVPRVAFLRDLAARGAFFGIWFSCLCLEQVNTILSVKLYGSIFRKGPFYV